MAEAAAALALKRAPCCPALYSRSMQGLPSDGMEGQIIAGKYRLLRLLGQGGMGAVYEARNTATSKRCAIKLLISPDLTRDARPVRRFLREARACGAIESDHVVEVHDSGSDPDTGCPYIVMEFLSGEDLEALRSRLGALEPTVACKIVLQAAIGLTKAHAAGVVHRDIKPANLFLAERDEGKLVLKVLDFGVAMLKADNSQDASTALTLTGSLLGTPRYMSPEQCSGSEGIDARTDVWSLGVVLWELLAGAPPFANARLGPLMAKIMHGEVPLLQSHAPWVGVELAELVHRAMARQPEKRFQNASELRDALLRLTPGGPQLTADAIRAISNEHKAEVAPRWVASDPEPVPATVRGDPGHSLEPPTFALPAPTKSRSKQLAFAAFGALALGGIAMVLGLQSLPVPVERTHATPNPTVEPSHTEPPSPSPVTARYWLPVAPSGVTVRVDGVTAVVANGSVELQGAVGTVHAVELRKEKRKLEATVTLTSSGVVPSQLELEAPSPIPSTQPAPAFGRHATPPRASASVEPAPVASAETQGNIDSPSPSRVPPEIATATGEFGIPVPR